MNQKNPNVPDLGLGFRFDLRNFIAETWPHLDTLEITVDHYIGADQQHREQIEHLVGRKPLVAHGVGLSLGTDVPLDVVYLKSVADTVDRLELAYYSEHLAFTRVPGGDLATLLPLPRTPEVVRDIVGKIRTIRSIVPVPFYLENIVTFFDYPDSVMSEAEFLREICEQSGAGILLDLENLYANSENNGTSAEDFIDALPPGWVQAVHVAGGLWHDDLFVDDHGHPAPRAVLELLERTLKTQSPRAIILERDNRLTETGEIRADLDRLRACIAAHSAREGLADASY